MNKAKIRLLHPFQCWCLNGRGIHKHFKLSDFFIARKECLRYNNQKTKCFCPQCDNELCGSNSWIASQDKRLDIEFYKCSKCGNASKWDFGSPCPVLIEHTKVSELCVCGCEIAKMVDNQEICADCELPTGATHSMDY